MDFEFLMETFVTMCLVLYYTLESVFKFLFGIKKARKDVTGQIVLVTGSASGIGKLISSMFARLGAEVVMVDVNEGANEEAADEIRSYGGKVHTFQCNISLREEVYKLAKKVDEQVGRVNILVNNAGVVTGKLFLECPDELIERSMAVNINAHFWTVKAFLPAMMEANQGHIVSIASSAGLVGVKSLADYCSSKFAAVGGVIYSIMCCVAGISIIFTILYSYNLLGFMESLALEIEAAKKDVKTTTVCPYFINTGMFDGAKSRFHNLLPIQDPHESAGLIVDAVLRDQPMILIPKLLYILIGLKGYLPRKALYLIYKYSGAISSMDDFKSKASVQGSQEQEESNS